MFVHHSQKPLNVGSYLDATFDFNILGVVRDTVARYNDW